jgi:hypothetical protein
MSILNVSVKIEKSHRGHPFTYFKVNAHQKLKPLYIMNSNNWYLQQDDLRYPLSTQTIADHQLKGQH